MPREFQYIALTRTRGADGKPGEFFVVYLGNQGWPKEVLMEVARAELHNWWKAVGSGVPEDRHEESAELENLRVMTLEYAVKHYRQAVKNYLAVSGIKIEVPFGEPDREVLRTLLEAEKA